MPPIVHPSAPPVLVPHPWRGPAGQPHGVILAGGAGRRIGGNKHAALLAGRPLLDHVIARLAPHVARLAISTNTPIVLATPTLPPIPNLPDARPGLGPLAGILAGLRWAAADGAHWLLVAPCDTPFLPATLAARLSRTAAETGLAMVCAADSTGRLQPTICLIDTRLADHLEHALDQGIRAIREWRAPASIAFTESHAFFNVNTAADLRQAEELRRAGATPLPQAPAG